MVREMTGCRQAVVHACIFDRLVGWLVGLIQDVMGARTHMPSHDPHLLIVDSGCV
jgi:hypothetical protein